MEYLGLNKIKSLSIKSGFSSKQLIQTETKQNKTWQLSKQDHKKHVSLLTI